MAINPNEAPEGYVAVEGSGCKDCALKDCSVECWYAECAASSREDGHYVIFVKKVKKPDDGKATASWPYDSEGTPVEVEAKRRETIRSRPTIAKAGEPQ